MSAIPDPGPYPTQQISSEFLPLSWDIQVQRDSVNVDLTGSDIAAPVYNGTEKVGELTIDRSGQAAGVIKFSLDAVLYAKLDARSTWRFNENTVFGYALARGDLVKVD